MGEIVLAGDAMAFLQSDWVALWAATGATQCTRPISPYNIGLA